MNNKEILKVKSEKVAKFR